MNATDDSLMINTALHNLKGASVEQVYQSLTRQAALGTGVRETYIQLRLMEQERRATSGIGNGVAIPQMRLKKITQPYMLLAKLARPIDFNAVDRAPVDLVFLLLSPDNAVAAHLQRLSRISRLLRNPALCNGLRDVASPDGMAALMMGAQGLRRAA